MVKSNYLALSWSTSRGRDTYGYMSIDYVMSEPWFPMEARDKLKEAIATLHRDDSLQWKRIRAAYLLKSHQSHTAEYAALCKELSEVMK